MKPIIRDPSTGRQLEAVEIVDSESGRSLGKMDSSKTMDALRCGNLTLDTDLYELTMAAGYNVLGKGNQMACFDLYYRKNPDEGAFCLFAGLESVINYVNNLKIYPDDIEYLKSTGVFSPEALDSIAAGITFTGDIWAVPEGTVVFPSEPLIRVTGPIAEAQVLETTLLALIGHQTLIATKAARMCIATKGGQVVDFGARRAHGVEAALYGARAAYIGGCAGTSNVKAGKLFGIPIKGTHAHSWVESFDSEIESFEAFAKVFPDGCILLVDTYDILEGTGEAIKVAKKMRESGKSLRGIRLDSGDLAYYSKAARTLLDEAGFPDVKILASSDLDEWIIETLRDQGACIDIWCVGTRLMTSFQTPALGVIYKLVATSGEDKGMIPRIKISQNPQKVTNPGVKKIFRFYNGNNRMIGDLLAHVDEPLPSGAPVKAHHPMYDYMKKTYKMPYSAAEIMVPIFLGGKQVYQSPGLEQIRQRSLSEIESLEPEYKRFVNAHIYKVSLSDKVYQTKKSLLNYYQEKIHANKTGE